MSERKQVLGQMDIHMQKYQGNNTYKKLLVFILNSKIKTIQFWEKNIYKYLLSYIKRVFLSYDTYNTSYQRDKVDFVGGKHVCTIKNIIKKIVAINQAVLHCQPERTVWNHEAKYILLPLKW